MYGHIPKISIEQTNTKVFKLKLSVYGHTYRTYTHVQPNACSLRLANPPPPLLMINHLVLFTSQGFFPWMLKMANVQVMDLLSKMVFMWHTPLMVNWRPLTIQMTVKMILYLQHCVYMSLSCFLRPWFPFFLLCKYSNSTVQVLLFLCTWNLITNITSSFIVKVEFKV